jgi:anaerobic dimethyl sulfoxide reductase subunit A
MATHTIGYETYRRYLLGLDDDTPKSPAWAEPITGAPAATIYQLAHDYGALKPAALFAGWGPQRQIYGEQIARAFVTLACLGGNVGVPGGGLASVDTRRNLIPVGQLPGGSYAPARFITPGSWACYILEDRLDPPLKLGYIVASNVINRSPDARANVRALQQLDFVVVHEQFMTPTARCADLVLPIVTDLERSDLVTSWGHDSHLFHMRQAIAPLGESRTDYWILSRLAERLGFGPEYTQGRSEDEWVAALLQNDALDGESLRRDGLMRTDGAPRVALAEFRADPIAHPLKTPSGRIEITSEQAVRCGLPAIPSYIPDRPAEGDYPLQFGDAAQQVALQFVRPRQPLAAALGATRCVAQPVDAAARGVADGDPWKYPAPKV